MIKYKEYVKFNELYKKQEAEIERRLMLIKSGIPFGHFDPYGSNDYYPLTYIDTIDPVDGLIKVYEKSIQTYSEEYVLDLFIAE